MNRDIIFRAKCFGNWRYGNYIHFVKKPTNSRCNINYKDFIITNEDDGEHYYPITDLSSVGQYTGLKDKDGKRIFEGDIVIIGEKLKTKVVYYDGAFRMQSEFSPTPTDTTDMGYMMREFSVRVIGNIHDNSELLKGGK
ncbi:YopX family protein [Prevotella pallens]|uniref:YopX family protein n=1 Tax=Prevotella pallens TaxID=60133 RepID=UPI00288C508C|nr:YopX family protein [Prevotella pallens]